MSIPPKPASASEYTVEEWNAFYRQSFEASTKVLTYLEREIGLGLDINPQQAGCVLLLCMGRLAGRYGYRHLGAEASWQAWTGPELRPLFEQVFAGERATED